MYHVACFLNSEQHRRLIGNDIAVVIFVEDGQFDPKDLDTFGTVPQIYAIVQPVAKEGRTVYRMGFITRTNVKSMGPYLGQDSYFEASNVKDWLLTKRKNLL